MTAPTGTGTDSDVSSPARRPSVEDLARVLAPRVLAPGDLALVMCRADGRAALVVDVEEGTRHVDELFLRHVTSVVHELGLPLVVAVACSGDGRPRRVHRALWHELTRRLSAGPERLADLVVVGPGPAQPASGWSAAGTARRGRPRPGGPSESAASPRN